MLVKGHQTIKKRSASNHVHGVWCDGVSVGLASNYLILDFKTIKFWFCKNLWAGGWSSVLEMHTKGSCWRVEVVGVLLVVLRLFELLGPM